MKNTELQKAIIDIGLNKSEVAKQIGVSTQTLRNMINLEPVSMKVAIKTCEVLNKSLDDLFWTKDKKENN